MFEASLRHMDMSAVAFHFLEEIGEVADAMARMYSYKGELDNIAPRWAQAWLEEELADVSSWLFAIVGKADSIRETAATYARFVGLDDRGAGTPIRLSQIVWARYGLPKADKLYCPHCKNPDHCECKINIAPTLLAIDEIVKRVGDPL